MNAYRCCPSGIVTVVVGGGGDEGSVVELVRLMVMFQIGALTG